MSLDRGVLQWFCGVAAVAAWRIVAGAAQGDGETTGPTGIKVQRRVDVLPNGGWELGEGHASLTNDSLIRAVGPVGDQVQTFRSVDGGETWTLVDSFPATEPVDEHRVRTWTITGFYLDPVNGRLMRLLYDVISKAGSYSPASNRKRVTKVTAGERWIQRQSNCSTA